MGFFTNHITESKLDSRTRNTLDDSVFGLPEERKYPLNDADHVRSAIKLFGHCPESQRKELAKNIYKYAKKYDVAISDDCLVSEYISESYIIEAANEKKYKCCYCDYRATRDELATHIEEEHEDLIPKGYSPTRLVFDIVNNKNIGAGYGTCRVCKGKTSWNEKTCKYNVLCENPKCRQTLREKATKNMVKVYGKTMLLDDPEHQQKMLANRSISGKYKFSDGGYVAYTGSYEKKCLEFFDKVLEVPSTDIMAPGPTLEYKYKGETLHWITDIYYIPYNLIIEIKDGGSNPNKRVMPEYRGKQYAKEEMITSLGTYNYLRLTDNDFSQLLYILADMKSDMMDVSKPAKTNIKINESGMAGTIAGAIPSVSDMSMNSPNDGYTGRIFITNYLKKNKMTDWKHHKACLSNDIMSDKVLAFDEDGYLTTIPYKDICEGVVDIYEYVGDNRSEALKSLYDNYKSHTKISESCNDLSKLYTALTNKQMLTEDQIDFDPMFKKVHLENFVFKAQIDNATIKHEVASLEKRANMALPVLDPKKYEYAKKIKKSTDNKFIIQEDEDGYFLYDVDTHKRTPSYKDIYKITTEMTKYF